jgi:hypothetical protein
MRREAKAGLLVLAMLGLLLLVTLAARGSHPGADGEVTSRAVPATVQDTLVTLLAIGYVAAIVFAVVILFRHKGKWQEPKDRHWLRNYVIVMVVIGLATLFGYLAITHGVFRKKDEEAARGGAATQTQTQPGTQRSVPVRQAHFQWEVAAGLGGLVVACGLLVYLRRRRDRSGPVRPLTLEEDLARAAGASIDDLRNEPDARRAVVAAYAQMEGALAVHGLSRRRADAPLEYLTRVLRELEVRESAVRTLTELFEYARFSPHAIDAEMKEQAIDALVAVRDDLRPSEVVTA